MSPFSISWCKAQKSLFRTNYLLQVKFTPFLWPSLKSTSKPTFTQSLEYYSTSSVKFHLPSSPPNRNFITSPPVNRAQKLLRSPIIQMRKGRFTTSSREGNGYWLQYSCLENCMKRSLWARVHGVAQSQPRLRDCHSNHIKNLNKCYKVVVLWF